MTKLTPYPWQLRDVDTLRRNNWTGLLRLEAGGGKSLTATLAIMEAKPRVTLIIAPQSTHETAWIPTLRDNAGITPRIIGNGNKAAKEAYSAFRLGYPGIYLASPQWVTRTDVSDWSGDMLIIDEIHQGAVTPKSKMQRKVSGYVASDGEPLNVRFRHRLALSATPMRGDFSNMWGVCKFLWPDRIGRGDIADYNFIQWQYDRMDYVEVYTNQRDHTGQPKKVKQFQSEKNPGRLISEMPCVITHTRRETCCAEPTHQGGFLPVDEPQVIERTVPLTAKQRKAIREMSDSMFTWLNDNPLVAEIPLTAKQRIRQLTLGEGDATTVMRKTDDGEVERTTLVFDKDCASPVVDETIHILSNLPTNEPVTVFMESQRFAEVMTYRLNKVGFSAAEYSGVRKADLSRFGQDFQVLVGVVSAIGTGTAGLNKVCSTEIWAEQPVSLTLQIQTQARLERMDNTRQVQRYVLLDDEGVQLGRMEDLWMQKLVVNRSLRTVA